MGAKERSENLAATRFMTMTAFCRATKRSQHCPTFCHLSCGRSELGSEKRKRFCARLSGPRTILERWTATSSRIIYPEVSFLRSWRGLSFNILPLRAVRPQQTHLLNEPISYLRRHGNPMPEAKKKDRSRGGGNLSSASS